MKEHSNIQRRVCNIPAKPGHTYCVGLVTIILPTVSSALAGCYADGLSRSLSAGAGRYGYGVQGPTEHNIYRPLGASFSAVQRFRSHTALRSPAVLSCPARAAFLHQKLMMACIQCDMCVSLLHFMTSNELCFHRGCLAFATCACCLASEFMLPDIMYRHALKVTAQQHG
jgi:hypothetical protein